MAKRIAGPVDTTVLSGIYENFDLFVKWMAVSDTGTMVYVPGSVARRSLVWIDRMGRRTRLLVPPDNYQEVAISPRGTHVAFVARQKTFVLDLRRLTTTPIDFDEEGDQESPVWIEEGDRLVFVSTHEGANRLYVSTADGSRIELFAQLEEPSFPIDASRDGVLSFDSFSDDNGADIWTMGQGEEATPYLQTAAAEGGGVFSPDGRHMAYHSVLSNQREVYVSEYPQQGQRKQVSVGGGHNPRWSRVGDEIFYVHSGYLMAVSIDTRDGLTVGTPERLFELHSGNDLSFDVAPDGRGFLTIQEDPNDRPDRIHVVSNWFEELNRLVPTD